MIKHLVSISIFLLAAVVQAASIVDTNTIAIAGRSAFESGVIYGGIAGTCATNDGVSPCNSCVDTTGATACNQSSVYGGLKFSVSFRATAPRTNAVAQLYLDALVLKTVNLATYTANDLVTLEVTWGDICSAMGLAGLDASCNVSGVSQITATKTLKFGIGADNNGTVPDADMTTMQLKVHAIPAGASGITQSFCADSSTGSGACNITFVPGDEKAFIDAAAFNPTEPGGTQWEAIAVFPIATPNGAEANAYNTFTSGAVSPIFRTIDPATGDIPDSQITGGLTNYQQYCLVYGTRNKAQNIYKFVTDPNAAPTGCITPSEVVGVLEDKHCFISTAAFGSQDAPEVEIFRKFRNEFLLTNFLGKIVVKTYYAISPPIADVIAGHEYLKTMTRATLYPALIFAMLALRIGFWFSLLLLLGVPVLAIWMSRHVRGRAVLMVLALCMLAPQLVRAEIFTGTESVQHPGAKEGLIRIKKDGTYVYDVKREPKKQSSHLRFGQAMHPEISIEIEQTDASGNPTGNFQEYTFEDFYNESSGLIIGYDYEWFPWMSGAGKLGVQAGVSGMFVTGNGRLVATPNPPSRESYTFITMPITLGAIYRLEWKDQQLFVPYVSGGGTYVVLAEKREDKSVPNFAGGFGFYGTGGVLLNLSAFDRSTGLQLDSEYGIGNLWLSLEYRVINVNSDAFGFSNNYVNAGLSFDF